MSEELIYLTRCCHLVEEKWQRGESKFWKNGNYQKLSELVSTTTRISISPDTLKRLFGKTKTYRSCNPQLAQPATRNEKRPGDLRRVRGVGGF
jgi:hypothetical protein